MKSYDTTRNWWLHWWIYHRLYSFAHGCRQDAYTITTCQLFNMTILDDNKADNMGIADTPSLDTGRRAIPRAFRGTSYWPLGTHQLKSTGGARAHHGMSLAFLADFHISTSSKATLLPVWLLHSPIHGYWSTECHSYGRYRYDDIQWPSTPDSPVIYMIAASLWQRDNLFRENPAKDLLLGWTMS